MALRIAVIVDCDKVQRFALDALDAITGTDSIVVFSCTNTRIRKRWFRHFAYYTLNLVSIRNRLTRFVPVTSGKKAVARTEHFRSEYDGIWQVLPPVIVGELKGFDIVLKFGMGLLKVPSSEVLPVPILSYHHGDPDLFRGRPAGFWEMAENVPIMGQVVQVIGDRLDAGKVVAFAETKVFPWSYRATLIESYRHSALIIDAAIRNAISGTYVPKASDGRNCRLPSNLRVLAFIARMASRALRRLFYGAFQEKAWRVSTARVPPGPLFGKLPPAENWQTFPVDPTYRFYADPFFTEDAILVEAVSRSSGLGQIVKIDPNGHRLFLREAGHMSYPATAWIGGREIIVPEIASWSEPRAYSSKPELLTALRIEGSVRVSDPTLLERNGRIYLFGNDRAVGSAVLHLWSSESLEGDFEKHPASPIRISPRGGRMGGNIIEDGGRLYRVGQDCSRDYGNGLIVFEIMELNPHSYSESEVGRIRFAGRKGPHTLNIRGGEAVFDWYRDAYSLLAGFRRVVSALQSRRRPQATQ